MGQSTFCMCQKATMCCTNKSSNTYIYGSAPAHVDVPALIGDFALFEKVFGHTSAGSPLSAAAHSTTTINDGLIKPGRPHPSIADYARINNYKFLDTLSSPRTVPCQHREAAYHPSAGAIL